MEQNKTNNKIGRPINPIVYTNIEYNGNKYTVGKVINNDSYVYFVIDKEDYPKIKDYSWHSKANTYIGHTIPVNNTWRERTRAVAC